MAFVRPPIVYDLALPSTPLACLQCSAHPSNCSPLKNSPQPPLQPRKLGFRFWFRRVFSGPQLSATIICNLYKDGQGLIFTSDKTQEEVAKNKAVCEATVAGKAACAEAWKENALNKVCTKDQNTRLWGQYEVEKAAYENWVAELRADGVPAKQLPAKPWWPFSKRSREDWEQGLTAKEIELYSQFGMTVEDSPDSESSK